MADHDSIVSSDKLKAIADAIRDKTGKNGLLTLDDMPDEIESISGGGGQTPTCGVVPTSWSAKGYVLSADTYGNISDGAFRVVNPPNDFDSHNYDLSSNPYSVNGDYNLTYLYMTDVSFETVPEIIGSYAFSDNYWLSLTELPEGVEDIGQYAFYNAYNVTLSSLPSTVNYIGDYAFSGMNDTENTIPNYSNTNTYSIGDIVYYSSYYYVCIEDIDTPEEFDSNKWYDTGSDPCYNFVGVYDRTAQYSFGDVVLYSDSICTMLSGSSPATFNNEYCPNISGFYNDSTQYSVGDVAVYEESDDAYSRYAITCISATSGELDWEYWVAGDHPTILGKYSSDRTYSIGDVVAIYSPGYYPCGDYEAYTCMVPVTSAESFDPLKWVAGDYSNISGLYDTQATYVFGDTVIYSDNVYTCITSVTSPEAFDNSKWIEGYYPNMLEIFDTTHSYSAGDTVAYKSSGASNYEPWTCYEDVAAGSNPGQDYEYWTAGYYPGMEHNIWSYTGQTHTGDVLYDDYNGVAVTIIIPAQHNVLSPVSGYHYGVKEEYQTSHQYIAGDVIYIYDNDNNEYYYYVCISPTYITGEFDNQYWNQLYDYDSNQIKTLEILGTPETITSNAFSGCTYDMLLVPWSEGDVSDAPWGFSKTIIYDYNPGNN